MMVLSTKGRYAARIMVYLAGRENARLASKFEISEAEGISPDYVEQIMLRLKAAGLVESHRGRAGGFSLARDPAKISLADVLNALEGPPCPAPCIQDASCPRAKHCPTRGTWLQAASLLDTLFSQTSIARMAQESQDKSTGERT
ncbi:MAG: Rrf2 family transcriptional regulator [Spartobacteria bacterium]|nr:Rrf2 family transcriptional regulator [Spartobacteria bacterium]